MDRGYLDFRRLHNISLAASYFVTRAKSNFVFNRLHSLGVDKSTGVLSDQIISLRVRFSREGYPDKLRRIRFLDAERNKRLVFLTNNFSLPAQTFAQLYRSRWQVESSSSGSSSICASSPHEPVAILGSLQMAALGVLYVVDWLGKTCEGLLVSAAVLGWTSADALTISMTRGGHGATPEVAAPALSLGIITNTALKAAVALALGKGSYRWLAAGGLVIIGLALALSLLFLR